VAASAGWTLASASGAGLIEGLAIAVGAEAVFATLLLAFAREIIVDARRVAGYAVAPPT
jgi:O-antigen ligase